MTHTTRTSSALLDKRNFYPFLREGRDRDRDRDKDKGQRQRREEKREKLGKVLTITEGE